jgi:hypothetical protein
MTDNDNEQAPTRTRTFEDAFQDVPVDLNIATARSRFVDDPENLEDEVRRLRANQEEVNDDFNQGRMYEDTVTRNLPFNRLLNDEIDLNRGDMSRAGRQLYQN